jgi:hypothetical protein
MNVFNDWNMTPQADTITELAARMVWDLAEIEKVLIPAWMMKTGSVTNVISKIVCSRLPTLSSYYSIIGEDYLSNACWLMSQAIPIPKYEGFCYAENKTGILIFKQ